MNCKFNFLPLICLLSLTLVFPKLTLAADLVVSCVEESKPCSLSSKNPLFSKKDGFFVPNKSISKIINFTNKSSQSLKISLGGQDKTKTNDLEKVIIVQILNTSTNNLVWQGTLANFYAQNQISLGTLDRNKNQDFTFSLTMDPLAPQKYENTKDTFDLYLKFWGDNDPKKDNKDNHGKGKVLGENINNDQTDAHDSWFKKVLNHLTQSLQKLISLFKRK